MILLTGSTGFIGSALQKRLGAIAVDVDNLPRVHARYFLHFGSASSNILFNDTTDHIRETVVNFIKVVEYCKKRHIKLIFPSSATTYANNNNYAHTKSALEEIAQAYEIPFLALRIFAGYGPGEEHKKDYASVVYQWCRDMSRGISPVVYGDGTQSRDFVYIDDIVKYVAQNLDREGIFDVGTGVSTSFNRVVKIINEQLGTKIKPIYIGKPTKYIHETRCANPLEDFISLKDGVKKICQLNFLS